MRNAIAALSLVFFTAHLPFLPPTLEDIDSINFALAVNDFDVAKHQPHPPGYPVFVALGKAGTSILRLAQVPSPEVRGLAIWSAISGAALTWILYAFLFSLSMAGRRLQTLVARDESLSAVAGRSILGGGLAPHSDTPGLVGRRASRARHLVRLGATPDVHHGLVAAGLEPSTISWWATVVAVATPLFWFTALRPLSDMTGLAAAVAAQALVVSAIAGIGSPRALMWGAFVGGLAIGVRSQTFLLTLPLLGVALLLPRTGLRARDRLAPLAALAVGVLAWGVPLILASGGPSSYAAALGSQAGEDFSGVVMLWTTRTARVALDAVMYSFLWPWGHPVAGGIVVVLALIGAVRLWLKMPHTLAVLLVAFAPYAAFHLLFHETVTVRYALPLIVPIAYLAVCALDWAGRGATRAAAVGLVVWSIVVSVPAVTWYGRHPSPAFQALEDAARAAASDAETGTRAIGLHAVGRRGVDWLEAAPSSDRVQDSSSKIRAVAALDFRRHVAILKAPHGREWLMLINQWRADPNARTWFVADPRRTDLALFDPRARIGPTEYRWGFVAPSFVGGTRPGNSDLYAMAPPGWMLDRGWALSAEIAGVTARDGLGPHRTPSVAWVRTRGEAATLLIGGRHLGVAGDPAARVSLSLAGVSLDSAVVKPGFFFRVIELSAGSLRGDAGYRALTVEAGAADGSSRKLPVALEQFDLQSTGVPMVGAQDGWYEPEYDPRTARAWRWSSERSTLWVRPVGRDVTLTLSGESPLRYYDAPPAVVLSIGGREVARFSPSADFTQEVVLPASALAAARGEVVITSDKFFVPAERGGSLDRRHLALKIYSYGVR